MSGKLALFIEEVPAVAGKVNVKIEGERTKVRVEFGVAQEPRFFERFLKGRPVTLAPWVMSRICGVCSQVHLTCSIEAAEKALGLKPKPEVFSLREVAKGLEIVQNNVVHVLMSIPDFTGHSNVVEFSKAHPSLFGTLMAVNSSLLEVSKRVAGRFVHLPSLGVATHGKPVSMYELISASKMLKGVASSLMETAEELSKVWGPLCEGFKDPAPTYCVLNASQRRYPFFSGELLFSDGRVVRAGEYAYALEELTSPYSNAHYVLYKGEPFYVGSRARLKAYRSFLPKEIIDLERTLAVDFSNPFDNVKAQYIEAAYVAGLLAETLDELASKGEGVHPHVLTECPEVDGEGVGLATAPRGVLIHHYRVAKGRLEYANIITPTVMNARHIEVTGEALVKWAVENGIEDEGRIKRLVAALVRAYDPCLPCSVH